ncbi:MAG TPA: hypothetical protein VMX54_18965 [Vicinamibacteria bacterium]|nr:hypothetical protein [Vicinamibacteria bacterium]
MAAIISKLSVQDAIEKRILKGDTAAFFKAVEHVIGKPRQATDVNQASTVVFRWAGEEESRLEDGRKRVADAKRREDASPEQATPRRDDA